MKQSYSQADSHMESVSKAIGSTIGTWAPTFIRVQLSSAYTLVISHSVCHLYVILCMNPHEILVQFEIHNQVLPACMSTVSISNLVQQINCVI